MRRVVSLQITTRFYDHPRVFLINSDFLEWEGDEKRYRELYQADGCHLTPLGFKLVIDNWIRYLLPHVQGGRGDGGGSSEPKIPLLPNPLLDPPEKGQGASSPPEQEAGDRQEKGGVESSDKKVVQLVSEPDNTVPDPFGSYTGKRARFLICTLLVFQPGLLALFSVRRIQAAGTNTFSRTSVPTSGYLFLGNGVTVPYHFVIRFTGFISFCFTKE